MAGGGAWLRVKNESVRVTTSSDAVDAALPVFRHSSS
jgi:hypothetical protein